MRDVFRRQLARVWPHVKDTKTVPSLDPWLQPMVEYFSPLVSPIYIRGGMDSARRINRLLAPRHRAFAKDVAAVSFNVRNPRIPEAVRRITFDFCRETLETTTLQIREALAKLREELQAGLDAGEANKQLAERVGRIFLDPMRATRIAVTEASRAVHGGQLLQAQESEEQGLKIGLEWLPSADACPLCLELEGKIIRPGEHFERDTNENPVYADIPHPPRHPHCMCTVTEVLL
jgi:hypothetical protein